MQLRLEPLALRTHFAFRIAHGSKQEYRNLLVRIEHDGVEGLGEAAPAHYYGETPATVALAIETWAPHLGDDPFALEAIGARLDRVLQGHGAARAAIEMALHDWIGKKLGIPVWRLFGLEPGRVPMSCVTLGMAPRAEMQEKLSTVADFPILKVKLGSPADIENLRFIRSSYAGRLQVDANASWTAHDAVRMLEAIAPLRVDLVEQPVARGDLDGLSFVRARSPIPIFADESAHHLHDIAQLAGRVDGVTLKLMKTGGLREMLRMVHAARAHGMKIMLGCMVESSLALSAAAQLAPLADVLDLDGHWLLDGDPFIGAPGERGEIRLSDSPGLGVRRAEAGPA
ncbi:MAG: dipeptide epimerase [Candidatus Eisenbacteria bacterium]